MLTARPQAAKAGQSLPPSSHSGGYMGLPRGQREEGQKWGNGRRRQKGAEEEGKHDINQVGEVDKWKVLDTTNQTGESGQSVLPEPC